MCVGEHLIIDRFRIYRQWFVVAVLELLCALKDAAIHEQPLAGCLHKIFRAGNATCSPKKSEFCHRAAILPNSSRPNTSTAGCLEERKRGE